MREFSLFDGGFNVFVQIQKLGELIDLLGVFLLVVGIMVATVIFVKDWFKEGGITNSYRTYRQNLGRAILLGLEFLVAGDIIRSVAGTPTFTSVGVLAIIVLIRTFLGFSFELEVNGRWPWQKKSA